MAVKITTTTQTKELFSKTWFKTNLTGTFIHQMEENRASSLQG